LAIRGARRSDNQKGMIKKIDLHTFILFLRTENKTEVIQARHSEMLHLGVFVV
jgi:hypothetical protein